MGNAKSPPPDLPGFSILRAVGSGGFADVFLFRQHSTNREVAVKVLRSEHVSDFSISQFQVEANVMAGVSAHPYIVTIHDAGVAPDGRPYIVMEHYPRPHFGVRARSDRLSVAELLKTGVQISAAVETAHRAQILHRDIKPANILTSAYGDPGLTDFGIAGVQRDDLLTAATGISIGYAAPELILDEHHPGSVASDVYALSATIYALLVGRVPVHLPDAQNTAAALQQRTIEGKIQPLGRADVPRALEHLLLAGLATEPAQRPQSAEAFGQALQDIEQSLHLPPTPLVLLGDAAPGPAPASGGVDATRARVNVIHADGPPAAAPPDPDGTTAARAGVADPPSSVPWQDVAGPPPATPPAPTGRGAADAPTEARGAGTDADEPTFDPPAAGPTDGRRPLPTRLLAIGAGLIVLAIIAIMAFSGGSGTDGEATTTTVRPSSDGAPVLTKVGSPTDLALHWNDDGSAKLTWTPPSGSETTEYRLYWQDGTDEVLLSGIEGLVDVDEFEVDADTVAELLASTGEDRACINLYAVRESSISQPTPVCAEVPRP